MKIIVTGSNGLLGHHLVPLLLDTTSHDVIATGKGPCRIPVKDPSRMSYHELDLTDGVAVDAFVEQEKPDAVIHAAAMTQVDECELNKVECWNVNVTATRFLLDAAKKIDAYFLLVSTDFVFDGHHGPYSETDPVDPVNYYGSTKVAAEKAVLESGLSAAIARTCLVYGNSSDANRNTLIGRVKESLVQQQSIKLVTDQLRTPTYVIDLAKGIISMLEKRVTGIYNISGSELMSPWDMAMAMAALMQKDSSLLEKAGAENFSQPAKRPATTGFIIKKAEKELGYRPTPFKAALQQILAT